MSLAMLISSESIYNIHHFGVSPIITVFFVEIRVIEFYPDFKAGLLQIYMGCRQQYGDHHKVHIYVKKELS